jgi:transposase
LLRVSKNFTIETVKKEAPARYERVERSQFVLEPVDVERLIDENHAARNIWNLLGRLDLSKFRGEVKAVEGHAGRNTWEPQVLIAIWLYAYSRGLSSARQIERECGYEPGLRWLLGLKTVNHHTLSDFRAEQGAALQDLFKQVLGLLMMERLITLERVTVDGTKVRAAANKKTFSRKEKIAEHLKVAEKHLAELQREETEQEKRGRQAAAQRRAARERVSRLENALKEVERLQKEKKWERDKPCQASSSDADAQFMRLSDHGLAPAYNVQFVTDAQNKLIVDVEVSKQPSDSQHLTPALERIQTAQGRYPQQVIADGDYTNRESVCAAAACGIDYYGSWRLDKKEQKMAHGIAAGFEPQAFAYDRSTNQMTCPAGKSLRLVGIQNKKGGLHTHVYAARREDCQSCSQRIFCTPNNKMSKHGRLVSRRVEPTAVADYHAKMNTAEAKAIYKQRAPVAEFPHAWMKDKLQWFRVRGRGQIKVKAEALWVALTYNLQRYFKLSTSFKPAVA